MTTPKRNDIIFNDISKQKFESYEWGEITTLFTEWGQLNISTFILRFKKETPYIVWAEEDNENLCLVEGGAGTLQLGEKTYPVKEGSVFKLFPGQSIIVTPDNENKETLQFYSVQKKHTGKLLTTLPQDELQISSIQEEKVQVYEYEALGQELIRCDYEGGLGLIRFIFAIDRIPIHQHPHADRIIRPLAGKGFTYADGSRFAMNTDTHAVFPKGTRHTNGPTPGYVYDVYAVQLPWVEPEVTEEDIGGSEQFVQYFDSVPPKELWKTKAEFDEILKVLKS